MEVNEPVISETTSDEFGRSLKLDYFVTNGISLTDGVQGNTSFGISVRLCVDGESPECTTIEDVTPSKEAVMRIIQLLAKNFVTPVTLRDVVEDCVAAQL